jgi:uncharacterized membrane protein (TIGR02234 family)
VSGRPSARRELAVALAALVAGGTMCLVFAGRAWGEAVVDDGLSTTTEQATGRDLLPLAPAVGLLALAAVVAIPATRHVGRLVVGLVLVLAGLATAIGSVRLARDLPSHVVSWALQAGEAAESVHGATAHPAAALLTGAGGLLVAGVGVAVLLLGRTWPAMGRRFDRDGHAGGEPKTDATRPVSSRDTWDALDRGDDPTA